MAEQDWLKTVTKLKSRLQEASGQGQQEDVVRKVLHKLRAVPMTLELLQLTHIGKEVNGLRRLEGDVGRTAKQLVKSWKQLLAEPSGLREETGMREDAERCRGKGKHRAKEEVGEAAEKERRRHRHLRDPEPLATSSRDSLCADSQHLLTFDSPSTSFLAPPTSSTEPGSPGRQGGGGGYGSSPGAVSGDEGGSVARALPLAGHRKRKAVLDGSGDAVALSKRTRTQVYSGKKATSGPQAVPALFDISMRVLVDNIDAIEEVGGVPYLILEPLLQKCTVSQLLRLEEFNPHFLEDSDVLWEKHCVKDFRGSRPRAQQTWRELYLSKLSEREQRLKNITANIRMREEARKEPVRQVKLATATRAPGRRRQIATPLPSRPSLLNRTAHIRGLERAPSNVSKLRKQTMKMAKERTMMITSRPGKR